MKLEVWTADQVRAELKSGRKSMVLKSNGDAKARANANEKRVVTEMKMSGKVRRVRFSFLPAR